MNVRQGVFLLIACIGSWSLSASLDAQQVQIRGPKNGTSELSGTTYGPITPEDTLWRIANRYRRNKNLSVYQVMQAIYELNPDAFEDQNFNHIKDGAILNLPSERYASRIDPNQARLKAEQDDNNWQTLPNNGEIASSVTAKPSTNVSKEDLSATKEGIEQKITDLDAEQNRQFMAIRQQFAESIDGVQSLLNENRKLVERLDVVDQEIGSLRGRVDEELQVQMDQMLALQNELLAISKEAEVQRIAEAKKSSFDWLTDPLFLILLSVLLVISLLGAFAMWMIRRNRSTDSSNEPVIDSASAAVLEQSDEMDDLADALANELSDDIGDDNDDDLFGDEDLLDDVLSDELEESLDSAIDEEFDSFDDLDDDSLDPVIEEASESLEDDGLLDQEDLDNLFDEDEDDLLADIEGDLDNLEEETETEASTDAELDSLLEEVEELGEESDDSFELSENDLEQALETPPPQDVEEPAPQAAVVEETSPEDEPDKPEISIDELLEQPEVDSADSIITDNSDVMNEEMLQNIDKEIASQNVQLDEITDELLNEIDQLEQMGGMLDESDDEEAEPQTSESQMGIQELDALSEDIDDDMGDDSADVDDIDSLLADNQLPDEDAGSISPDDTTVLDDIDSLLDQNQSADDDTSKTPADSSAALDDIDSLLAQTQSSDMDPVDSLSDDNADTDDIDNMLAENQPSDSHPAEQPSEDKAELDDIDSLLEQNQQATSDSSSLVDDSDQVQQEDVAEDISSQPSISNESVESLSADELLAELERHDDALDNTTAEVDESAVGGDPVDSDLVAESDIEIGSETQLENANPVDEEQLISDDDKSESDDLDSKEAKIDQQLDDEESTTPEQSAASPDIEELDKALEEFEQEVDDPSLAFGAELDEQTEAAAPSDESEAQQDKEPPHEENVELASNAPDLDGDIPSIGDLDSLSGTHSDEFDDADLDEALKAFDENLEPEALESARSALDTPVDADVELDDLPGLGDWLSSEEAEENTSIDELENTSFDELLDSIDEPGDSDDEVKISEIDDSGLDFNALLNDAVDSNDELDAENEADFLDVDDLLNESMDADGSAEVERELNLDAALESYAGIGDAELVDVDGDKGIGAKLDLAQAYIETDDIDSAVELLEEVISSGDDVQQQEATELLKSLKAQ